MSANVSRLIARGPGGSSGSELEVTRAYMTLGRSHTNDLVVSEPTVSRVHASLSVDGAGRVSVQDLGSSAGTSVNGHPTSGPVILRSGDVVSFGGERFQFQGASSKSEATAALPVQRPPRPRPRDGHVQGQYEIENQHAGTISNVAGNQYTAYVSHIRQERESFLQAVAATKTRARWLIWIGAGLAITGLVIAGSGFYQFMEEIPNYRGVGTPASFRLYITGLFIAGGGSILITIGIVLHVVATSRRKKVEREFPLPRRRGY
ncbi:FHA domain-containing protein [Arthrobacter humicola]|uniref:FHA domain-containing protein n=1 Tax=Arthrobacter humicola TaxID=409291 RepID=UPI001FABA87E|nr:FHA domain-containing protein [Arthrobacter humicola]MCI9870560.1 FHA domain-containing protein [Arthrobacter humicola]